MSALEINIDKKLKKINKEPVFNTESLLANS